MSLRSRVTFVALWVISILVVGVLASAQAQRQANPVIAGADLGFRPDGWKGKARTGTLMVRINGEWVEAIETSTGKLIPIIK
jgi:hypothetical protein